MTNDKDILDLYAAAGQAEVKIAKLEASQRELGLKLGNARKHRRELMDRIQQLHLRLAEPIEPYPDAPDLVLKVAG